MIGNAEGNRTTKFIDADKSGTLSAGDADITLSGYDQRNRLVAVSHVNAWTATQAGAVAAFTAQGTAVPGSDLELRYGYDYANRRIRRSMDADGVVGVGQASVSFAAYAGDVRTLEIAQTATVSAGGRVIGFLGQVVERNFYGNGEDEILAVDKITWNGSTPTTSTFWTFADHQGTIRDIVSGNAADRGKVVEHRQYDSFGKILARTATLSPGAATLPGSGVGVAFGYTGRPIDEKTGLSDDRARWYDANTGRFINEDPSGFAGGDTNLFRYVGNDPLDRIDPSGLTAKWAGYGGKGSVPAAGWGAYGTGGLMSVSEFGRLSGSLGSQPSSGNAAPKSSSQFMASATQLFMQHFTGKPGVHDLYSEKGFPVSARSVDSSGATRQYKFADGTRYMEPTEPSTAQYADERADLTRVVGVDEVIATVAAGGGEHPEEEGEGRKGENGLEDGGHGCHWCHRFRKGGGLCSPTLVGKTLSGSRPLQMLGHGMEIDREPERLEMLAEDPGPRRGVGHREAERGSTVGLTLFMERFTIDILEACQPAMRPGRFSDLEKRRKDGLRCPATRLI